ncbi:17753_t:CDS:2, partial [Funneliformis caledonium]
QNSRYTSPILHSHNNPFTEDTEDKNVIITNVPPRLSSSKSLEFDIFVNDVNILEKFKTYINEAILHANNKSLYVKSHTYKILSLSSIFVLISNSYLTKMIENFNDRPIRFLPFDKIRNKLSKLTLITNFLNGIIKKAFHDLDKYLIQWSNMTLTKSKIRKFDGSRMK